MNIRTLKKAIARTGKAIDIDEIKPNECNNEGVITAYLDQSLGLEFATTNATCICAPYWSDVKGSRVEAIANIVSDIDEGFDPMSEDTAYACGVDL